MKERYKDNSIDVSGAGAKVRKLIDEHLISLGINPKIHPVELMSDTFIKELEKNKSSKAKASEMEHAIRKHCKVNWEKDPALYQFLSEKLDALIQKHKKDWDQLKKELEGLREEVRAGRKESDEGVDPKEAPFYELIVNISFGNEEASKEARAIIKKMVSEAYSLIKDRIGIINFWKNGHEVDGLKGDLSDLILLTEIDELITSEEKLVTEITALAKARNNEILS